MRINAPAVHIYACITHINITFAKSFIFPKIFRTQYPTSKRLTVEALTMGIIKANKLLNAIIVTILGSRITGMAPYRSAINRVIDEINNSKPVLANRTKLLKGCDIYPMHRIWYCIVTSGRLTPEWEALMREHFTIPLHPSAQQEEEPEVVGTSMIFQPHNLEEPFIEVPMIWHFKCSARRNALSSTEDEWINSDEIDSQDDATYWADNENFETTGANSPKRLDKIRKINHAMPEPASPIEESNSPKQRQTRRTKQRESEKIPSPQVSPISRVQYNPRTKRPVIKIVPKQPEKSNDKTPFDGYGYRDKNHTRSAKSNSRKASKTKPRRKAKRNQERVDQLRPKWGRPFEKLNRRPNDRADDCKLEEIMTQQKPKPQIKVASPIYNDSSDAPKDNYD